MRRSALFLRSMGYRIRFKREALEQLDTLYRYILDRNPKAGKRILRQVQVFFMYLAVFPLVGKQTDEAEVRRFAVGKTDLLIYFTQWITVK